jgi:hypothetical protein
MVAAQCSVIGNVGSHCRDRLYGDDTLLRSPWVFAFSTQAQQSIVVDPKSPGSINSPHGLHPVRRRMRSMLARLRLREQA